ncbi:MAG TPA: hypothetical protein VLG27_02680 [Candidatus Saccharimonadia bacterium]|nr:hypothetical protein [Candidatus Saccharimonadia bacterium]
MPPDEPNDEEALEELPGDEGQTPFTSAPPSRDDTLPPDDELQPGAEPGKQFDDTEPRTDDGIDSQELYDAGEEAAAGGADDPHDDPDVITYTPPDEKS